MQKSLGNVQNKLAKESIFTALMILMEEKDYKEISISELTKKAGVSRMAYYRNYYSKDDIIVQYLDELFTEYYQSIVQEKQMTLFEQTRLFFSYFRNHAKLIQNLIRADITYLILDRFDQYLSNLFQSIISYPDVSPEMRRYRIEYFSGGLYKILIEWVKSGLKESDEEMADIVVRLIGSRE